MCRSVLILLLLLAAPGDAVAADQPGAADLAAGAALERAGDWHEAVDAYRRSIEAREEALGPDHPLVAESLVRYAMLRRKERDFFGFEIVPMLERAERIAPDTYPDRARILRDMLEGKSEAISLATEQLARAEAEHGADSIEAAEAVAQLVEAHFHVRGREGAIEAGRRALAATEASFGPDHPQIGWVLEYLAALVHFRGGPEGPREALPLYERALTIFEGRFGADDYLVGVVLNNYFMLRFLTPEERLARVERATLIFRRTLGPSHPLTSMEIENWLTVLQETGDLARARLEAESALDALGSAAYDPGAQQLRKRLAWIDIFLEDFAGAEALARDLVAHSPGDVELLTLLGNAIDPRRPDEKLASFRHAIDAARRRNIPDDPWIPAIQLNICAVHEARGENELARECFEDVRTAERKVGRLDALDLTEVHLGSILLAQGDAAGARALLEEALSYFEQTFLADHREAARCRALLARALALLGEREPALEAALGAEDTLREWRRIQALGLSERRALELSSPTESGVGVALSLLDAQSDPERVRRVWRAAAGGRALVLDQMGARNTAARLGHDPEILALADRVRELTTRLANLLVRGPQDTPVEEYRGLVERSRARKERAEEELAAQSRVFARDLASRRATLDDAIAALPPDTALVAFVEYGKVATSSPGSAGRAGGAGAAKKARPDEPTYAAFVLAAGSRDPAFVPIGAAATVDELVATLRASILEEAGSGAGPPAESAFARAASALRRRIWDPFDGRLGPAARVLVVPDGALNLVNFAALPGRDGRYLLETAPTFHTLTAERDAMTNREAAERTSEALLAVGGADYEATSLFASLKPPGAMTAPSASASPSPGPLPDDVTGAQPIAAPVLVASLAPFRGARSTCRGFEQTRFTPLPGTAREVAEVAALWRAARPEGTADLSELTGSAASEGALKAGAPQARILHLATHGFFAGGECPTAGGMRGIGGIVESSAGKASTTAPPENPLRLSGLALAGANHREAAGPDEDDGILTAEEIAAIDLSGVGWAVLSACDTGLGDIRAGEGVFGLRRAFQVAGAGTLIMSLWPVDDEATREWMTALYRGRLERKLDTAEAVRQASLSVLANRRTAKQSTHPFYWGAFVAAGDWR